MPKNNLWVCPKCKRVSYKQLLFSKNKCTYCCNICLDTNQTDDEWEELFYQTHPGKDKWNTFPGEIFEFCANTFLQGCNTIDENLVAKRTNNEEEKRLDSIRKYEYASKPVSCPKCGSTSISTQKRGFKWGRAIAGVALTGFIDIGAVAGAAGSNKMINVCQRCGHQWEPR